MFHLVLGVLHTDLGGVRGGPGGFGGLLLSTGSAPCPSFPLSFSLHFVPSFPSFFPDTLPYFSLWLFPRTFPFFFTHFSLSFFILIIFLFSFPPSFFLFLFFFSFSFHTFPSFSPQLFPPFFPCTFPSFPCFLLSLSLHFLSTLFHFFLTRFFHFPLFFSPSHFHPFPHQGFSLLFSHLSLLFHSRFLLILTVFSSHFSQIHSSLSPAAFPSFPISLQDPQDLLEGILVPRPTRFWGGGSPWEFGVSTRLWGCCCRNLEFSRDLFGWFWGCPRGIVPAPRRRCSLPFVRSFFWGVSPQPPSHPPLLGGLPALNQARKPLPAVPPSLSMCSRSRFWGARRAPGRKVPQKRPKSGAPGPWPPNTERASKRHRGSGSRSKTRKDRVATWPSGT